MNETQQEIIWYQFGGSMDMLDQALAQCPDEIWDNERLFWYWAYHCIFYLDYYLTLEPDTFAPPEPFTLSEFEAATMPPRTYTREELRTYLAYCKERARALLQRLDAPLMAQRWENPWRNYSVFELLLYNMRHVQHHTAQLNLMMRWQTNTAPDWISRTRQPLKNNS
ncbi:MAG: DinB family protein [Chitinophagales bacterium]